MITQDNFRKVLDALRFTQNVEADIYYATFNGAEMRVDFGKKQLFYADGIIAKRDTTQDFHQNENFVVFECVCRLLELGYPAKNIELEATSGVSGRGQTQTYLDILVKDNDGKNYLIVECKTAGKEFDDAWKKVLHNGGQLFNYWTLFGTKHLCLYASDFNENTEKIIRYSNIINFEKEDEIQDLENRTKKMLFLDENNLTGYKDLGEEANQSDYFNIWKETYKQPEILHGIFEDGCAPYEISERVTIKYSDLKEVEDYEEIQRKYHEFATIMRQHNVGSHENSFDKLVNLFLAKIVDETDNQEKLAFNWRGLAFDDYFKFQDRLQEMYSKGMEKFLGEKVEYITDDNIYDAFEFFKDSKEFSRDAVLSLFHKQKFFTNNDFSFIDVHNEQLFHQNIKILIKVVEMLQGMKLKTQKENQFLGDLFEGFLDQGVKQSEGQFFTPTPIVKFLVNSLPIETIVKDSTEPPKVIDFACGAGHFLNEVARRINFFAEKHQKLSDVRDYYSNIFGIEKEYRLSKVAKVSAFMYSQDDIQIVYGDALSQKNPHIENGTFDILVANPPYSVKGFLETLDDDDIEKYELYTENEKTLNIDKNNSIETFFVERAGQLLKAGGVAAIILPSSILSNGNIYIDCRHYILKNFDIVAIAEFGSGTFGKTGTNTATLFLRRKNTVDGITSAASHYKNRVESWFKSDFKKDKLFKDELLLKKYCSHCAIDFDEYKSWLCGENYPGAQIFSEYKKEFEKSSAVKNILKKKITAKYSLDDRQKEVEEKIQALIKEIESEKLYYFILAVTNPQKVLIAKSPNDNKEMKSYLGYEWSGAKGSEGIKYLGSAVLDDEDQLSKNKGIMSIKTPLFNPNDYDDETKINVAIRKNFNSIDNGELTIENFPSAVNYQLLTDMLDFSRTSFDCSIRTNVSVKEKTESTKWKDGIAVVKLGDVAEIVRGVTYSKEEQSSEETKNIVLTADNITLDGQFEISKKVYVIESKKFEDEKRLMKNDVFMCFSSGSLNHIGKVAFIEKDTKFFAGGFMGILRAKKNILPIYLYNTLNQDILRNKMRSEATGTNIKNLSNAIAEIKIPLPSIELQKKIVEECEKIDSEAENAKTKIESLKNEIEEIMSGVKGEKKKLGEVCKINEFSINPSDTPNKEFIYIDIDAVENGTGLFSTEKKILGKNAPSRARRYANFGSTIISTVRPNLKGFAYINEEIKDAVYSTGFAIMKTSDENILLDKMIYLFFMYNKNLMEQMTAAMPKGQYPSINKSDIESFIILLPSLPEQKVIVQKIEAIENQIAELKAVCDRAGGRKKAVLERELCK